MRKALMLLGALGTFAFADAYEQFTDAYSRAQYRQACEAGIVLFKQGEKDEKLLSLIGSACAESDYINFLGRLQSRLRTTPEARANATYFATLVLQKRFLYQFMYDGTDLGPFSFPTTPHPVSVVFEAVRSGDFEEIIRQPKTLRITRGNEAYNVYIAPAQRGRICIDIYENGQLRERHRYL